MEFISNDDKMFEAVLLDPKLMEYGKYERSEITTVSQALNSDNVVVNAVARIIRCSSDGESENEIYKQITAFLKQNV